MTILDGDTIVTNGQSNKTRKAGRVNIETALKEAMTIDGALGVCLVDWDSGMSLGGLGGGKYLDLDVAAASKSVNSASGRRSHQVASAERAGSGPGSGRRPFQPNACLVPILDISASSIIYAVCVVRAARPGM